MEEAATLLQQLQNGTPDALAREWDDSFQNFIKERSNKNATFRFHLAESIGGPDGYSLLWGCMKNSLVFSYLNGASYYATFFCTQLLADHCSTPPLIQGIKTHYFSVPYEGSVNFALDTL